MRNPHFLAYVGFSLLLVACTTQPRSSIPNAATTKSSESSVADLMFDPEQVRTEEWFTYTNDKLGFSLKYPKTFVVSEDGEKVIVKRNTETSSDKITMIKTKSTLAKEIGKRLYQATRIEKYFGSLDRPVETTVAHYQSGDANSWFMTY